MSDVSVIGLGVMGSALARALMDSGHSLTVWNRSSDKAEALVSDGAIAAGSAKEAIEASPLTITCITSHDKTIELFKSISGSLEGKTIVELSTGSAAEATELASLISGKNADWLIGIINGYPSSIGKADTVLTIVGGPQVWEKCKSVITTLGGSSAHVGNEAAMAASLFAALFTTRQGFMFGMIYGALVCKKAGIPLDAFASQIPVTMGVLPSYYQYFADTVPSANFDNPQATMATYAAALDDALATFKAVDAPAQLPQLFADLAHKGIDSGLSEKALTALVELLGDQ